MSIQSEITRINGEVTSQANLISQIQTALQGKAAGGGSSSCGTSTEQCYVTCDDGGLAIAMFYVNTQHEQCVESPIGTTIYGVDVARESIICVVTSDSTSHTCTNAELVSVYDLGVFYIYRFKVYGSGAEIYG